MESEPRIFRAAEFQARHLADVRTSSGDSLLNFVANVPNHSNLVQFRRQIDECAVSCAANAPGADPHEERLAIAACPGVCATDLDSVRFHYFHDLAGLFPLYEEDLATHTAFVSMTTSMADSAEVGRNAIGSSGREQIGNLQEVLSKLPTSTKYIVLVQHHPPLWNGISTPPRFHWSDLLHLREMWDSFYTSAWFLSVFLHNDIDEGEHVYKMLQAEIVKRPGTSVIFAFGHRHERSLSRIGAATFEEAPNLATTNPDDYGFYLVGAKDNQLNISWCPAREN